MSGTADASILGLKWWGPGPADFAEAARRHVVRPVVLADLASPIDRRALRIPGLSDRLVSRRVPKVLENLIVVTAPHRLPLRTLQRIRARGCRIVAWLGDIPEGDRSVPYGLGAYDDVFAADGRWVLGSQQMPWPHLVPESLQVPADGVHRGESVILVGTAYAERVAAARRLRECGIPLRVVGRGWPGDVPSMAPMPRIELLAWLRARGAGVVNMAHPQMRHTLNPFFFDLAAAGIPQIYVGSPNLAEFGLSDFQEMVVEDVMGGRFSFSGNVNALQDLVIREHNCDARIDAMK